MPSLEPILYLYLNLSINCCFYCVQRHILGMITLWHHWKSCELHFSTSVLFFWDTFLTPPLNGFITKLKLSSFVVGLALMLSDLICFLSQASSHIVSSFPLLSWVIINLLWSPKAPKIYSLSAIPSGISELPIWLSYTIPISLVWRKSCNIC